MDKRFRFSAIFHAAALCVLMGALAQGKTIFDDDWTPPKSDKPVDRAVQTPPAEAPAARSPTTQPDSAKAESPANTVPNNRPVAAPTHRPIPPAADQAKSRKLFKDFYAKELADHSVAGRKALVTKLLDQASAVSDAPSDEFVLLVGATQAAREAGDLGLLMRATDALVKAFEVDGLRVQSDAALQMTLRNDSPTDTAANCQNGLNLVDQLAAAEDLASAQKLLKELQAAAPDAATRSKIQRRAGEIDALKAESDRIAAFTKQLKTVPDDPVANLELGQHLCYAKNDWPHGLPLLARGSDATAKSLAAQELKKPTDSDGQLALADGWWAFAQTHHDPEKTAIQSHAQEYFRAVLPQLKGLERIKVQARLPAQSNDAVSIASSAAGDATPKTIDLLALDSEHRRLISGHWSQTSDGFQGDSKARILFDYMPPESYDIYIECTRLGGGDGISVLCPLQHGVIAWNMGGWGNTKAGFLYFRGRDALVIKQVSVESVAKEGQRVACTIHVRKDSVEGIIDGLVDVTIPTDGAGGHAADTEIDGRRVVGLSVRANWMVSKLRVTEIAGQPPSLPGSKIPAARPALFGQP